MSKLFLFVLVLIGVWYVRRLLQQDSEKDDQPVSPSDVSHSEKICECRHCGVLVPESEGLIVDGMFFCSAEHARSAGQKP